MGFFVNYIKNILKRFDLRIERIRDPFADIQRLVDPLKIDVIIDGGAYHGIVSKKFISFFPNSIVYAFEPLKASFAILEKNTNYNPNIKPINCAISSASGQKEMHVNEALYTSSLFPRSLIGEKYYPDATKPLGMKIVDVVTLDEWAGQMVISRIDIIKLDLQGHELEALKGATD